MGTIATVSIGTNSFSVYALTANAVPDANTFFAGLLGPAATAWGAADSDNRKRALFSAAEWMDRAVGAILSGTKTVSTQARAFPRNGASCNGVAITDGTTPDSVAFAEFWLAGQLLADASLAAGAGTGSNVKEAKAGSASVTFFTPTIGGASDTRLPVTAMDYLKCLFSGAGVSIAAGMATGVSSESAFGSCDFKRSEGYS